MIACTARGDCGTLRVPHVSSKVAWYLVFGKPARCGCIAISCQTVSHRQGMTGMKASIPNLLAVLVYSPCGVIARPKSGLRHHQYQLTADGLDQSTCSDGLQGKLGLRSAKHISFGGWVLSSTC